ncbi:MAG TPA: hypothetical protein VNO70_19715, partial [Blastocatellia bacterium]|nr:hypothetical protein [Blastocatellia bacterium]
MISFLLYSFEVSKPMMLKGQNSTATGRAARIEAGRRDAAIVSFGLTSCLSLSSLRSDMRLRGVNSIASKSVERPFADYRHS